MVKLFEAELICSAEKEIVADSPSAAAEIKG